METSKLEELNHWWLSGKVDPDLALPFKRDVYADVKMGMARRLILALTGLRRVGKTTIIYQLIKDLLDSGTDPTSILFFSFDETQASIDEVISAYRDFQKKNFREEKVYVFLDEVQKCSGWENAVKKYYDLYPKLKFVISGSESLFIRKKTKESLAGRVLEFSLGTFSFKEYLRLKGIREEEFKYQTKIEPLFSEYVQNGGFPETLALGGKESYEYIRSLVADRIVYKDIPKLFRIDDPEFLRVILELVATNPGMYVDYQAISRQFGKDRRVVKDYFLYLKESFLIRLLGNYRRGSISTPRKMKRAYVSDNAIIRLYRHDVDAGFFGRMVECAVVNKINANAFWKDNGEVDAVCDSMPIGVKYQESISPEDFRALREFMKKFKTGKGIMVTKHDEGKREFDEGTVELIPAYKFMLSDMCTKK